MKIALVNVCIDPSLHGRQEMLYTGCAASFLEQKGFNADIYSASISILTENHFGKLLASYDAVLFCGREFKFIEEIAASIKSTCSDLRTIAFGPYISLAANMIKNGEIPDMPSIDVIISGEPEKALYNELNNPSGNRFVFSRDMLDADELPPVLYRSFPGRATVMESAFSDGVYKTGEEAAVIYYQRGCSGGCDFCQEPALFGGKVRYRTSSSVIDDIRELLLIYGIRYFTFEDPWMTCSPRRMMDLCDKMKREFSGRIRWRCHSRVNSADLEMLKNMRDAGCVRVDYGVENAYPEHIMEAGKGFDGEQVKRAFAMHREIGLPAFALMIAGLPGDTVESIEKSAQFANSLKPEGGIGFSPFRPVPGTKGWDIALSSGKLITKDFSFHSSHYIVYEPDSISASDLRYTLRKITGRDYRIASEDLFSKKYSSSIDSSIDTNCKNLKSIEFKSIEIEGRMFIIDPEVWQMDNWDEVPANLWKSDGEGLSHIVCRMNGFIEYGFNCSRDVSGYPEISFRGCSQSSENSSIMTLTIDNEVIDTLTLPPKSLEGENLLLRSDKIISLDKGAHLLRLDISEGKESNGLSLFTEMKASYGDKEHSNKVKSPLILQLSNSRLL